MHNHFSLFRRSPGLMCLGMRVLCIQTGHGRTAFIHSKKPWYLPVTTHVYTRDYPALRDYFHRYQFQIWKMHLLSYGFGEKQRGSYVQPFWAIPDVNIFFVPDSLLISIHFIIHVYIYVDYGFNKHRIPLLLDQIVLIKKTNGSYKTPNRS